MNQIPTADASERAHYRDSDIIVIPLREQKSRTFPADEHNGFSQEAAVKTVQKVPLPKEKYEEADRIGQRLEATRYNGEVMPASTETRESTRDTRNKGRKIEIQMQPIAKQGNGTSIVKSVDGY